MNAKFPEELREGDIVEHPSNGTLAEFVALNVGTLVSITVRNVEDCKLETWRIDSSQRITVKDIDCRCIRLPNGMGFMPARDAS